MDHTTIDNDPDDVDARAYGEWLATYTDNGEIRQSMSPKTGWLAGRRTLRAELAGLWPTHTLSCADELQNTRVRLTESERKCEAQRKRLQQIESQLTTLRNTSESRSWMRKRIDVLEAQVGIILQKIESL